MSAPRGAGRFPLRAGKVLSAEKRQRMEGHFAQHGMKLLLLARFLPPMRTGVFLIAGATRFSFLKFLLADVIYAVVGVGLFFFCGTWILGLVHKYTSVAVFIAALGVMLYGLYMYYKLLLRRDARAFRRPRSPSSRDQKARCQKGRRRRTRPPRPRPRRKPRWRSNSDTYQPVAESNGRRAEADDALVAPSNSFNSCCSVSI